MGRVIRVERTGGPEVLVLATEAAGDPGPGQVRIRVAAAGVNFIDVYFRTGLYPRPLPFVLGLEGAGSIEAVGRGVTRFAVGDRVAWATAAGSYADHLIAPADALVAIPDGLDAEPAAAVMLQGMTAHYLTHGVRAPAAGDRALVHAAAGGVGLLLIQTLREAGVRVIGTCSSPEKEALARGAGAEAVVRYDREDFAPRVREWSEGRGVDVVYDSVGRSTFEGSLACLRPRGLLCLFGQSSGPVPPFDLGRLNSGGSLFVTRPSLAHYTATREELEQRAGTVLGQAASGRLSVRIGGRFPLDRAAEAHAALEGRGTSGKLLLTTG
ncbi:MAG: quinone oxidoreductase family protein [Myxococcota bacterium]